MTKAKNTATYGRAKAIAQAYSEPINPPCQVRCAGREPAALPTVSTCCVTLMFASTGLHDDLGEDLVASLEGLINGIGHFHAVLDHVGMRLAPQLLRVGLPPGR